MRLVYLDEIKGNEIAANNIIDIYGRILIAKGSRIKSSYLNRLLEVGITSIYIEDEISEGITIESVLCDETKHISKIILESEMNQFLKKKEINLDVITKVANTIINEILTNQAHLINLKDIRLKDEYLFSHSINVCALVVFFCIKMGFDQQKIKSIATGAILHDFGKMLLPKELLLKTTPLTDAEYRLLQQHPTFGYEALKEDVTMSPIAKMVIYMHHERIDGSGYPNQLKSDKIHDAAKITAICNEFDNLTSDRPGKKAQPIADVIEYFVGVSDIYFDGKYVNEFLKYIPVFAPGSIVLLNNGIVGIVVRNHKQSLFRPVVRLLYNTKNKIKYGTYTEVDLMQELTLKIVREIPYNPIT